MISLLESRILEGKLNVLPTIVQVPQVQTLMQCTIRLLSRRRYPWMFDPMFEWPQSAPLLRVHPLSSLIRRNTVEAAGSMLHRPLMLTLSAPRRLKRTNFFCLALLSMKRLLYETLCGLVEWRKPPARKMYRGKITRVAAVH